MPFGTRKPAKPAGTRKPTLTPGKRPAPSGGEKPAPWMFRDSREVQAAVERHKVSRELKGKWRPEVWLTDGSALDLVFLDETYLGMFYRYYFNGRYYTAPLPEEDLFSVETQLDPSPAYLFEVINFTPYEDKDGKLHEEPRVQYLVLGAQSQVKRLETLASRNNGGSMKNMRVLVEVDGKGKERNVNIDFQEVLKGDPLAANKLERRGEEKAKELYAPPSVEAQKQLLGTR